MRAFWPCIDSKGTTTFKAQRGSKDIVKIVHVSFVVQLKFHEAMRIFLCTKKTKITLFNNFFSSVSLWLNHWCHMDYFIDVLTTFLGLDRGSWVDLYGGSESSWISFEFVFWRWTKVLWVWKDLKNLEEFGWIIPLKPQLFASTCWLSKCRSTNPPMTNDCFSAFAS